jgi:hypothetical protein
MVKNLRGILADLIYQFSQKGGVATDRGSSCNVAGVADYDDGAVGADCRRGLGTSGKKHRSKRHPARRPALRLLSSRVDNLEQLLSAAPGLLRKDGYVAIISYHSLEDGLVKRDFKHNQTQGLYRVLTKKPIVPDREEIAANPRARSAKLRIAQKN